MLKFPSVHTKNYVLRKIQPEDLEDFIEVSFYNGRTAKNIRQAREIMLRIEHDFYRGDSVHWAIADKKGTTFIGACGLYHSILKDQTEVGFALKETFLRQGIMSEILPEIVKFSIKILNMRNIVAVADTSNAASVALLKKSGFVFDKVVKGGLEQYRFALPKKQFSQRRD